MKLTDIDLRGLGRFCDAPATFSCEKYHLPLPWDYVYTNAKALLRVKHDGGGYLQLEPPGGPALFKQERGQSTPLMFAWIVTESKGRREAFSNFWLPTVPALKPGSEPDEYTCTFAPDAARWRLRHDDWRVDTEFWVPPDSPAVVMTVTVTNETSKPRSCSVVPVVKPHMATFSLAPWDVPHLYQTCAFCRIDGASAFWLETRNPGGDPSKRLRAAIVSDLNPEAFEVSADRFIGAGSWESPNAVWEGRLALRNTGKRLAPYGRFNTENGQLAQPPIAAMMKTVSLRPRKSFSFTLVFGKLPDRADGSLPPRSEVVKLTRYLDAKARERAQEDVRIRYARLFSIRRFESPDECLNRCVSEWLPLQLDWVTLLDRGWPTGMRGTRDAAQDATGIVPLDPSVARRRLVEIFSAQRSDGWFLRQYSTAGRAGVHDHRSYVDAGLWVWELLWEYLCYTRDFKFLNEKLTWLDVDGRSTVLDHAVRLFEYYLRRENLGEHGLCKIREGDWNDSVNRAGVLGRGESVMVSCQAVLGLEQAAELFDYVSEEGRGKSLAAVGRKFLAGAARLRGNLLKHALNRLGYFNGVFNDAGKWVFSPRDPDGRKRVNGPVNSFAVISGVASGKLRDKAFDALNQLKGPNGWRLFYPGIGDPPISNLGRIGSGDKSPGLSENGTPYNHGSHGFLGRAAWSGGRGTMLHKILRYTFSYDQQAHPVEVSKTAPYAVVNHWKEAVGLEGVGGDTFLSGTISTALRNCYQGMVGFRPGLREIVIDPVIPAGWDGLGAEVQFLGGRWTIKVRNPRHAECGVKALRLDGKRHEIFRKDARLERRVAVIPISELKPGAQHVVEVMLG